jgi:hemolysin-activating ACP:hemolysin acyltransferase
MTTAVDAPLEAANPAAGLKRSIASYKYAALIGQVVTVMMRTPQHRQTFLADLEWLVFPAIANNQYALSEATDRETGASLPVAVALWALVSEEVDRRLTTTQTPPIRLKAEEWNSGSIPWLVEAVGEPRATAALLKALLEQRFGATGLKTIGRDQDGRQLVRTLKLPTSPQGDELRPS